MKRRVKVALDLVAVVVIGVLAFFFVGRPIFFVSISNNTTSDVMIWSTASNAPRGTLVRVGTTQFRVPAKSSVKSSFNQLRICPSSGCRLSQYPLALVVERSDLRHTYHLTLPGMGSSHNPCGNLHFCTVNLRLEDDGRIYYAGAGDGDEGIAPDQPEGFPAAPEAR